MIDTPDDDRPLDPIAFRRHWQRRTADQGASEMTLAAHAALYDAGRPLTLDELTAALLPTLEWPLPFYVEAWWLRTTAQKRRSVAKARTGVAPDVALTGDKPDLATALRRWLGTVFARRAAEGRTLVRDGDRFRPGPTAPRALTTDGTALVSFTPEMRHHLEAERRASTRHHLAIMELRRAVQQERARLLRGRISLPTARKLLHWLDATRASCNGGDSSDVTDRRTLK